MIAMQYFEKPPTFDILWSIAYCSPAHTDPTMSLSKTRACVHTTLPTQRTTSRLRSDNTVLYPSDIEKLVVKICRKRE